MEKDIYEQYVDATIAVFMEEYSDAETEYLLKKCKEEPLNEEFPEELDIKCKELIRKSFAKKKRQKALKASKRILQRVAVFVLVLTSAFSVLFLAVEAVRTPIINFYLENFPDYSKITVNNENSSNKEATYSQNPNKSAVISSELIQPLIPKTYELELESLDSENQGTIVFRDENKGSDISIEIKHYSYNLNIDTEDCSVYEEQVINGCNAVYIEKRTRKSVVWIASSKEQIFSIVADDLRKEEVLQLASDIIQSIQS